MNPQAVFAVLVAVVAAAVIPMATGAQMRGDETVDESSVDGAGVDIDRPLRLLSEAFAASQRGEVADAEVAYREALDGFRDLGDPMGERDTLVGLGLLLARTGRVADGAALLREAIPLADASVDRSSPVAVRVQLARLYLDASRPIEALPWADAALIAAVVADQAEYAGAAADVYLRVTLDIDDGDATLTSAIDHVTSRLSDVTGFGGAMDLPALVFERGVTWLQGGDGGAALASMELALRLADELGRPDLGADYLTALGFVALEVGELERARSALERVIVIPGGRTVASLSALALIDRREGWYDDATARYRDAIDAAPAGPVDAVELAEIQARMAELEGLRGQPAEARRLHKAALAGFEAEGDSAGALRQQAALAVLALGGGGLEDAGAAAVASLAANRHPLQTPGAGVRYRLPDQAVLALAVLAEIHLRRGDHEQARKDLVQAAGLARRHGRGADDVVMTSALGFIELHDGRVDQAREAFERAAGLQPAAAGLEPAAGEPTAGEPTAGEPAAEEPAAGELQSDRGPAGPPGSGAILDPRVEWMPLYGLALLALDGQDGSPQLETLAQALARRPVAPDAVGLQASSSWASFVPDVTTEPAAEIAAAMVGAGRDADALAWARRIGAWPAHVPAAAELQASLGPRDAALLILVGQRQTVSWVITGEDLEAVVSPVGYSELQSLADELRSTSHERISPRSKRSSPWREPAQALHETLIAPLAPLLSPQQLQTLWIGIGEPLADVPFAMLWDGHQHLVQSVDVRRLGTHGPCDEPAPPRQKLRRVTAAVAGEPTDHGAEIAALRSRYHQVRLVSGRELTVAALQDALGGDDLVHVVLPVRVNQARPASSRLVVSGPSGSLGLQEIRGTPTSAKLVILSAPPPVGDPVVGLAAGRLCLAGAFVDAGAAAVLLDLWPVTDEDAGAMLEAVVKQLDRQGAASSLARAQREAIAAGLPPRVWASWIVVR